MFVINDIFKLFGEQTADILFEIITECMDDYLYIFDLQNNIFEIHSLLWNDLIYRVIS